MAGRDRGQQQLGLFSAGTVRPPTETSVNSSTVDLGARVPGGVFFGSCSWTFKGWQGEVYHHRYRNKQDFTRNALAEYVDYPLFRTAEIDRTYYAPLPAEDFASYGEMLPPDYVCAIKVWQEITTMIYPRHPRYGERAGQVNPNFLSAESFSEHVVAPIAEGFSEHVGPLIFQIPPAGPSADPAAFEGRLAHFLARAPSGYRYAIELRDRRLLTRRYLAILRDFGATHVFNYWSRMPSIKEQRAIGGSMPGPFVVARLMLPPGRQYGAQKQAFEPFDRVVEPQHEMRSEVIDLIHSALECDYPIYIYVNNKAEGSAPHTVRAIARGLVG